jgi:acyl-CoA thioesterase FadM
VQLHFDFRKPALLDEQLEIGVWVGRIRRSSIRLEFLMRKPGGEVAAEAHMVIVAMDRKTLRATGVPEKLLSVLAPYRADMAAGGAGSMAVAE